jgi:hypothetical protein
MGESRDSTRRTAQTRSWMLLLLKLLESLRMEELSPVHALELPQN